MEEGIQLWDTERWEQRVLAEQDALPYDVLVVAAGARTHYFGNDAWERPAPGLKTLEDAAGIRTRILTAFEAAEQADDPEPWLRFVVVGAEERGGAGAVDVAHDPAVEGEPA